MTRSASSRQPTPPAPRFPLIPLVAPLVVSAVLFLVIRSPYLLVFALLGPVMALASWWEARRQHRLAIDEQEAAAREEEDHQELLQRRVDEAHRAHHREL